LKSYRGCRINPPAAFLFSPIHSSSACLAVSLFASVAFA
jgi:hypothetical protein